MKPWWRQWKVYLIGAGGLVLLALARCHFVAPALRRPDAVVEMKTTGYCPCGKCCNWKRTWYGKPVYAYGSLKGKYKKVGKTASGRMARPGTVAVDPQKFPMGTKFYIPGYGWARAEDSGGAIKGNHLDLFFRLHSSGKKWGVQTKKVKVWVPRD